VSDASPSSASGTPAWLLGRWRLLHADAPLELMPGTRMDFREGAELLYTIAVEGREFDLTLVYRVDGDLLLTDNPAAPHSAATRFTLGPGEVLVFDFGGPRAHFVREK
jgi:hypothetical protein